VRAPQWRQLQCLPAAQSGLLRQWLYLLRSNVRAAPLKYSEGLAIEGYGNIHQSLHGLGPLAKFITGASLDDEADAFTFVYPPGMYTLCS